MRKLTIAALMLLFAAVANAATDRLIHKTVALDPNGRVSIDSHNGTITVAAWNRPEVDVQARVEAVFGLSQSDVDATEIRISGSGGSVTVSTVYPDVSGFNFLKFGPDLAPVHYTIQMPATAQLHVTTHNAEVRVRGLRNDVEIESHNGDINVADFDGAARLESHNGGISVSYARLSRPAQLSTHNGSIDVHVPQNSAFRIDADGHHLDFDSDFPAATRRYESSHFRGEVNGGGPELRISTHNGSVRVRKS